MRNLSLFFLLGLFGVYSAFAQSPKLYKAIDTNQVEAQEINLSEADVEVADSALRDNETQKTRHIHKLATYLNIFEFINMANMLGDKRKVSPVNPHYPPAAGSYNENNWHYWKHYPVNQYSEDMRTVFMNEFTLDELSKSSAFYERPFNSKIFNLLYTKAPLVDFNLHPRASASEELELSEARKKLIKGIIKIYRMDSLLKREKEKLRRNLAKQKKLLEILSKDEEDPLYLKIKNLERDLEEFEELSLVYLGRALADVSDNEILEFFRVCKNPAYGKVGQTILNLHYFLFQKHKAEYKKLLEVMNKDKDKNGASF